MNIEWVRIRSWHAIRPTRSIEPRTLCGRRAEANAETRSELSSERSCESCLRIVARQVDGGTP